MWGIVKKAINSRLDVPLDTTLGQRNDPVNESVNNTNSIVTYLKSIFQVLGFRNTTSATTVDNTTSVIGYLKGIFTRANNIDTRLTVARAINLDNMTAQVRDSANRLTAARATAIDNMGANANGVRVRFSIQRGLTNLGGAVINQSGGILIPIPPSAISRSTLNVISISTSVAWEISPVLRTATFGPNLGQTVIGLINNPSSTSISWEVITYE